MTVHGGNWTEKVLEAIGALEAAKLELLTTHSKGYSAKPFPKDLVTHLEQSKGNALKAANIADKCLTWVQAPPDWAQPQGDSHES